MNYFKSLLSILITSIALQPMQLCSMDQIKKPACILATAAALGTAGYYAANKLYFDSIHWNWKKINPTRIQANITDPGIDTTQWVYKVTWHTMSVAEFFKLRSQYLQKNLLTHKPDQNTFLWGAATSAYQVESNCCDAQWNLPEIVGKEMDGKFIEPALMACDAQNHEDEDIQNMVSFGLNAYRFSVEWSKIYPAPGVINYDELERYTRFCKKLVAAGIKPVITLYHYSEPAWFYALGGFEKTQNIRHYVEFCTTVYNAMHNDVYLWFTFNAPEGIALQGWLTAAKPPKKKDMKLAIEVLHNIMEAHVQVYQAFKALPNGHKSRVGILKNIMQLDPWDIANPYDHLTCYFGRDLADETIYRFLTTGEFYAKIPKLIKAELFGYNIPTGLEYIVKPQTNEYIKNGGKCLDFIGLNYYCHNYMKGKKTLAEPNSNIEPKTNTDRYTVYGEGLYRALVETSERIGKPLNVPIYITENGVATDNTPEGNALRTLHNQRYLYGMARAIQDGVDVRGYIHWSLMDNYEWGIYKRFYGLYHVDRTPGQDYKRTLKDGAQYYKSVVLGSRVEPKARL